MSETSAPSSLPASTPAPLPPEEELRLRALRDLQVLDTPSEQVFDDLAVLAATICDAPVALLSLVDEKRQWFKARVGLKASETPRDVSFCAHAILDLEQGLTVVDAEQDPRFAGNPLVTGEPKIRAYAGMPIVLDNGQAVGTVCAIDHQPRAFSPKQLESLRALARQAARLLQWRRHTQSVIGGLRIEMQRSNQALQQVTALVAGALTMKAYVDRDRVYRYVNEVFLERLQLQRHEVEGKQVAQGSGSAGFAQVVLPMLEQAFAGDIVRHGACFDFPSMGPRMMSMTYLPVRDEHGIVCAVVVRAEDVNDVEQSRLALSKANQALARQNRQQQRFIHMISHDVREPLNSICNFAGLLEEDHAAQLPASGRRYLNFVLQGGQRMRQLLDDLLAYERLDELNPPQLQHQAVNLNSLFNDLLLDLDESIRRQAAQLTPAPLPTVQGDATLLRLLFQNLVANALKFHAPGQPPQVSWGHQRKGKELQVWVQDRGIGIAASQQGRLFEPFARLVTRRQFEGSGLGLVISQRIAALHGGHISLQSAPGSGSRFTLALPLTPEERLEAA